MNEPQNENVHPEKSGDEYAEVKKWDAAVQNMHRIIERSERKLVYFQNRVKKAQYMERPNQRRIRAASAQIGVHAAQLESLHSELRELERRRDGGIRLLPTEQSELRRIWNWINRPGLREILYPTRVPFDTFLEDWHRWITEGRTHAYSIHVRRTKVLIGFLLLRQEGDTAVVELVVIRPDYRARGYGTDVMRDAIRLAFEELHATHLTLEVPADNDAALTSFEKTGLRYLSYTDEAVPRYTMGIDRGEWESGVSPDEGAPPPRLTAPLQELMDLGL